MAQAPGPSRRSRTRRAALPPARERTHAVGAWAAVAGASVLAWGALRKDDAPPRAADERGAPTTAETRRLTPTPTTRRAPLRDLEEQPRRPQSEPAAAPPQPEAEPEPEPEPLLAARAPVRARRPHAALDAGPPPPSPAPHAAPHPAIHELPPLVRRVEITTLGRWQQPGLCSDASGAADARRTLMARFRVVDWDGSAQLYVDPRLPGGAHDPVLAHLESAEREVLAQLSLEPPRPNVFVYADTELLLAAGCTNDDVVAYYDGDLHVVATHVDLHQSVVHEYTHHALMNAGIVGPTWAQEGIAMNVARETWWRRREWLERAAERPFALESMEQAVPYTLSSEQALTFYVQAGAMVACATLDAPNGLAGFVRELAAGAGVEAVGYTLPALAEPSALRACTAELLAP